jgi:hypothetical protein
MASGSNSVELLRPQRSDQYRNNVPKEIASAWPIGFMALLIEICPGIGMMIRVHFSHFVKICPAIDNNNCRIHG